MKRFMVIWVGALVAMTGFAAAESPQNSNRQTSHRASPDESIVWHETMKEGWAEARSRNLPMVIYITSDQCMYCDVMKRDTLGDASVRRRIGRDFVAIRLKRGRNVKALGRIDVQGYPTTLIGVPQGKVVASAVGFQTPETFHALLSEVTVRMAAK